ncbi:MAG: glycosyltransferase [Alphaproteobacteria bacterium]|nr:glycosyltransferase [Alphaproteobacteria bacterium]
MADLRNPPPLPPDAHLPHVLIQLPTYNEAAVVSRALEAASRIDWPMDKLHIQLLDDSTDQTTEIARAKVEELRRRGVDASLLHRDNRAGFKAGALAEGLRALPYEFVAVFDADFVPPRDYLRRAMPFLIADPRMAFVQGRWEHLNIEESLLTRAQALTLDAHFVVEQSARSWTGLPMSFNGSGGVWRRDAIEDAGGWQYDTLTEDLDLSCRTVLNGWRSKFLVDLPVPGELPDTITAWRNQQFRWTKGFAQCAMKLLGPIWRSSMPVTHKAALTVQFFQGWVYPAGAIALLTALALVALFGGKPTYEVMIGLFSSMLGLTAVVLIILAAQLHVGRPMRLSLVPTILTVMALNSGLALSNSRAIWEAVIGQKSAFVRTPKRGDGAKIITKPTGGSVSGVPEIALAVLSVAVVVAYDAWYSPFLAVTVTGLAVVGGAAFSSTRSR